MKILEPLGQSDSRFGDERVKELAGGGRGTRGLLRAPGRHKPVDDPREERGFAGSVAQSDRDVEFSDRDVVEHPLLPRIGLHAELVAHERLRHPRIAVPELEELVGRRRFLGDRARSGHLGDGRVRDRLRRRVRDGRGRAPPAGASATTSATACATASTTGGATSTTISGRKRTARFCGGRDDFHDLRDGGPKSAIGSQSTIGDDEGRGRDAIRSRPRSGRAGTQRRRSWTAPFSVSGHCGSLRGIAEPHMRLGACQG